MIPRLRSLARQLLLYWLPLPRALYPQQRVIPLSCVWGRGAPQLRKDHPAFVVFRTS
jgi:hypothetical protein